MADGYGLSAKDPPTSWENKFFIPEEDKPGWDTTVSAIIIMYLLLTEEPSSNHLTKCWPADFHEKVFQWNIQESLPHCLVI